jgi:predicted Zn-dependent peptidase
MKKESLFNKTVLANGLRIVSERIPSARSAAIGIWLDVGSRDEDKNENGISHFIEHMLFKGTKKRSAKEIASYLEALGGGINAFTSREQTCYHATVLDRHLPQAVEILSDIILNSTLSEENLKREKLVVAEEISEVNENPSESIHELFSDCFWRGQPLGRPIMGAKKTLQSFSRAQIISYMKKHYRAGRIVVAASGNVSHRRLVDLAKRKFHFPPGDSGRGVAAESPHDFKLKIFRKKSSQTHLCLGFPGIKFNDPARNHMLALHALLGSGMSSILFQKIREEKGIAYSVYTFPDFYRDNGLFGIYLAADRGRLKAAMEIILRELRKLRHKRITPRQLDQIKSQMKGNLILGMESSNSRMNRLGRYEILAGRYISINEALRAIDKITANDMLELARRVFRGDWMTVASLGNVRDEDLRNVDWSLL